MINGKRIAVVMPAYNAEKTFAMTVRELSDVVDSKILVHDSSYDFVFDNQMFAQAVMFGFKIGEISCPTKYFEEAPSINFKRSVEYGLGVMGTTLSFVAHKRGIMHLPRFDANGRRVGRQACSQAPNHP